VFNKAGGFLPPVMKDESRPVPLPGEHEMEPKLTRTHQRTYETIFRHPAAHNLEWRDLRALLSELADVEEEPNGKLKVTRNGQTLVMEPDRHKDVADVDELMRIRHFLERSDAAGLQSDAPSD